MIVLILHLGRGGFNRVRRITKSWSSRGGCLNEASMTLENILLYFAGKQLSRVDTKSKRQIAGVRIHVERAIERLKDFIIFQGNLPLTLAPLADRMSIVYFALCQNIMPQMKCTTQCQADSS